MARGVRQAGAAAGDLVVDVDALEPERLELFVESAKRDRVGGAVGRRGINRHARRQQREVDELPPFHGQVVHFGRADVGLERLLAGLDQRRLALTP